MIISVAYGIASHTSSPIWAKCQLGIGYLQKLQKIWKQAKTVYVRRCRKRRGLHPEFYVARNAVCIVRVLGLQ